MNPSSRLSLAVVLFTLFLTHSTTGKEFVGIHYPNRLITPDFGIVTADDLAYDAQMRDAQPYDADKDILARYWQCVPVKDVAPMYRTWRGQDGMGFWDTVVTMCDLEIHIQQPGSFQVYGDRRAHPNKYCRNFDQNWRRLTEEADIVCLNGDDPSNDRDKSHFQGENYRSWTWNKFKTRKGCFAYFGDCDVVGCAEGKCQKRKPLLSARK